MRVFRTRLFSKFQKKEDISEELLRKAVREILSGLYEANLGGNVFKKRIAKLGQGKSRSMRSIIAYKSNKRLIFMFGFSKNSTENITEDELYYLKKLAKYFLELDESKINYAIKKNELQELEYV